MNTITLSDGSTVEYRKGHPQPWVRLNAQAKDLAGILPTGTFIAADVAACRQLEAACADQPDHVEESRDVFVFRQRVESLTLLAAQRTKYLGPRHTLRWLEQQTVPLSKFEDPHSVYTREHLTAAITQLRLALPLEAA